MDTRDYFVIYNQWSDAHAIPCKSCGASYAKAPDMQSLRGVMTICAQDVKTGKYIYRCSSCPSEKQV